MFQTKNEAVQAFYYQETSLVFNYTCTFLPKSEVVLTYLYRRTIHKREEEYMFTGGWHPEERWDRHKGRWGLTMRAQTLELDSLLQIPA